MVLLSQRGQRRNQQMRPARNPTSRENAQWEMELASLPLGSKFRLLPFEGKPYRDDGYLLDVTAGRCVVYLESLEGRTSLAHETPVASLGVDEDILAAIQEEQAAQMSKKTTRAKADADADAATSTDAATMEQGGSMAPAAPVLPDNPKHRAIIVRWNFQVKQLNTALDTENEAKAESARDSLNRIAAEAEALGCTLPRADGLAQDDPVFVGMDSLFAATPAQAQAKHLGSTGSAPGKSTQGGGTMTTSTKQKNEQDVPAPGSNAAAKASKAKAIAAAKKQTAGTAAVATKAPRVKKEKVLRECLDGCGEMVGGRFKMGHDAKLKSLILKIERGDEPLTALPDIAKAHVKFVKGETEVQKVDGKDVKVQLYNCTQAPVRFPGRDDIAYSEAE
jgi:hypothetical protein